MAISRIGATGAEANNVTLPGAFQNGDLAIIFAFRANLTAPSLPAGWTSLGTASSGASSYRCGWKILLSGADTSGTWTNATGVVALVYRGVATNKTPVLIGTATTATSATITYGAVSAVAGRSSWVAAFGATKATTATIETAPTNMTNQTDTVGAATEYVGHDSNAPYTVGAGAWPSTGVSVGTSAEYRTLTLQILAEEGLGNNYRFMDVPEGMSTTEKIV